MIVLRPDEAGTQSDVTSTKGSADVAGEQPPQLNFTHRTSHGSGEDNDAVQGKFSGLAQQ